MDLETYNRERTLIDKAEAYRAGRTCLNAEEAKHPDYASVDNAMRGRVERHELLRDLPDRFTAYLSKTEHGHAITVWTGDILGTARINSIGPRRGRAGDRQHYGRASIGGKLYAFQGPGEDCYCRLRAIKGN